MVSDRVGDFIIRLQNAAMAGGTEVSVPYSGHLLAIAKKLKELGFLDEVSAKAKTGAKQEIVVRLASDASGALKLRGVKRVSKPGRRLYADARSAHSVKGGTGARILSTSSGILSDAEARKNNIGGEELFLVW